MLGPWGEGPVASKARVARILGRTGGGVSVGRAPPAFPLACRACPDPALSCFDVCVCVYGVVCAYGVSFLGSFSCLDGVRALLPRSPRNCRGPRALRQDRRQARGVYFCLSPVPHSAPRKHTGSSHAWGGAEGRGVKVKAGPNHVGLFCMPHSTVDGKREETLIHEAGAGGPSGVYVKRGLEG